MMTRSGSGSSVKLDMQGSCFLLEIENLGCHILDAPDSHGSSIMVSSCFDCPGEGGKGRFGRKVSRKEASELRDLMVRDMLARVEGITKILGESIDDEVRKPHSLIGSWLTLWLESARPKSAQDLSGL